MASVTVTRAGPTDSNGGRSFTGRSCCTATKAVPKHDVSVRGGAAKKMGRGHRCVTRLAVFSGGSAVSRSCSVSDRRRAQRPFFSHGGAVSFRADRMSHCAKGRID